MIKPITITISHDLGRDMAIERIRGGFDKVGGSLGPGVKLDQHWEGDTLRFDAKLVGQVITGTLDVHASDVVITLVLPGLLGGMAHLIAAKVKKQSVLLLEKK